VHSHSRSMRRSKTSGSSRMNHSRIEDGSRLALSRSQAPPPQLTPREASAVAAAVRRAVKREAEVGISCFFYNSSCLNVPCPDVHEVTC
jgi:hypothetical protein